MIRPALQDAEFLADVQDARKEKGCFHLWWLGQSGFLLHWEEHFLLLDPYLSDSLTRKYADTDKPHVRMTERVVAPECLGFVEAVTSSHNHTDHLDAETLKPLLAVNPKVELVIPEANRSFVTDRLGTITDLPIGLDAGQSARAGAFKVHAVPAAHETVDKDEYSRCKQLGYVVEFGSCRVYHSGDTVWHQTIVEAVRGWQVEVALLPINGRAPERRVAGNLNGEEAARLAQEIGARVVIPCHYEMFEFNTATPDLFVRTAERIGQPYRLLRCGERWSSAELPGNSQH